MTQDTVIASISDPDAVLRDLSSEVIAPVGETVSGSADHPHPKPLRSLQNKRSGKSKKSDKDVKPLESHVDVQVLFLPLTQTTLAAGPLTAEGIRGSEEDPQLVGSSEDPPSIAFTGEESPCVIQHVEPEPPASVLAKHGVQPPELNCPVNRSTPALVDYKPTQDDGAGLTDAIEQSPLKSKTGSEPARHTPPTEKNANTLSAHVPTAELAVADVSKVVGELKGEAKGEVKGEVKGDDKGAETDVAKLAKAVKDAKEAKDVKEVKIAKEALKESLAEGLLAPDVVVRGYRIVRVMRAGQSNNVYVGISPTGQEVAIKEYFPRKLGKRLPSGRIEVSTQRMQDQFESGAKIFVNEAIALAEIRSPLLARVVAAFRENATAYLVTVMEPGETLEAYARRILKAKVPGQEFPHETDLRLIFWSLLHAVQVMHDAGYLHLDIKPSNVVMRDEFTPVLIDLGGARRFPFDPKKHKVTPGNFTLGFAAPEQHQERTANLCEATDIYGIGASILYCMTGKIPQVASERLVEDKMEDLLKLCKGRYSSQMVEIVRRCTRIRIEDRFTDVKEAQHLIASQ